MEQQEAPPEEEDDEDDEEYEEIGEDMDELDGQEEEEEEEDEEEEEEEGEGEMEAGRDVGGEGLGDASFTFRFTGDEELVFLRPRRKARKTVAPTPARDGVKRFWVRFDGEVMLKSHLELINISLKGHAHKSVAVLNANSAFVTKEEAWARLTRCSSVRAEVSHLAPHDKPSAAEAGEPGSAAGAAEMEPAGAIAGGRKRAAAAAPDSPLSAKRILRSLQMARPQRPEADFDVGYWAHVFDIDDIDEVWRALCSSHLFGQGHMGDSFELTVCHGATSDQRDCFDVLGGLSRSRRTASIALVVPCRPAPDEMAVVGEAVRRALMLRGPLYYRKRTAAEGPAPCKRDCAMNATRGCGEDACLSAYSRFFEVSSKDEHVLASQFKLADASDDAELVQRHSWGSFRFRPPDHRHEEGGTQLFRLVGVSWRPMRPSC